MTGRARISPRQIAAWLGPRDRAIIGVGSLAAGAAGLWLEGPLAALGLGLLAGLTLPIALIDARHLLIPDRLSLPLLPLGLIWHALRSGDPVLTTLTPHLTAMALMAAGLGLLRLGFRLRRGTEALGLGDVKLMLAAAAWIAPPALAPYVFCAAATGLMQALLRRGGPNRRLPFGFHLALWLLIFVTIALTDRGAQEFMNFQFSFI